MDCFRRFKHHLLTLNLFENANTHINELQASIERLTTRIYLAVVLILLTIFTIYLSFTIETKTYTIEKPSQAKYELLQENYSSSLECPCSTVTIPHREFLSISPIYHEVCSSIFVSNVWLTSLHNINRTRYYQLDFRANGISIFQLLRTLCDWNKRNNQIALNQFESTLFISPCVLSPKDFADKTASILTNVDRTFVRQHIQTLHVVQESMEANQLVPAVQTTGVLQLFFDGQIRLVNGIWKDFCWCPHFQSNGIYDGDISAHVNLQGFITGCYTLRALMYSTLECLYNQSCVDLLDQTNNSYYKALTRDKNTSTSFSDSEMIISGDYFILSWQKNRQYSDYYKMCAPINCRYTIAQHADTFHILTNLFSVYGGLVIVCQFIVPLIVRKIRIWWTQRDAQPATREDEVIPIRTQLFRVCLILRSTLIELNVFDDIIPSLDPHEIYNGRLATRIYIVCFILIAVPLLLVNLLTIRLRMDTIENPSELTFEQLHAIYNNSLQCPCSDIAMPYHEFSNIIYKIHSICNGSHFIKFDWFVNFPMIMKPQFTILNSICERSRTAVDLATATFTSLELITGHALSRELLNTQVRAVFYQLKAQTRVELVTAIQLNRILTYSNKLMRRYNVQTYHSPQHIETLLSSNNNNNNNSTCHCVLTPQCIIEIVPSFYRGCYAVDAILLSTLDCFYTADCITLIESFRIPSIIELTCNATALNPNETRFLPNTTIESLLNELMLELWDIHINYTSYYKKCNPISCTYSYKKPYDIFSVLILLLGLFSGLNVILKILVPFIVKTIRNCLFHGRINFNFKAKLLVWNTFPTYASQRGDINQLYTEKLATRIYALAFIVSFVITAVYKTATAPTKNDIIYNPTLATFEQLQKRYGTTVKCPCKEISINCISSQIYMESNLSFYFIDGSFVSISPAFHQVCSSYLTSPSWLSFLFKYSNSTNNYLFILSQFQFLTYVCQITNPFALNVVFTFTNDSFISPQTIVETTLRSEVSSLMLRFLLTTSKYIAEMIDFIQGLIHGSGILSALHTNWKLILNDLDNVTIHTDPISYGNCSCGIYASCTQVTEIPGLLIGCYPSSAMMQSTLECFYNETCISLFFGANQWPLLNVNSRSRFSSFHTVKSIIDQLMIDEWKNHTNYTLYYEKCAPTSCSFSYSERFSFAYMMLTLTSLYGGLTMVLRFIVYYSVKYGRNFSRHGHRVRRVDVNENYIS
ncbi:hypothetical protein I4U23_004383 [Adineta vaga]|nr:hypothetical protein I4U23_004383 [Adineta vaga]